MNGIIFRMLNSTKNNEKSFQVWGSGEPVREWIYMPDVANIIKNIVDEEKFDLPNPINLGQEFGISIKDTVNIIKNKLNSEISIEFDLSKPDGAPKKVLGKKLFSSFFSDFKFTNYEKGIEETIKYYEELI
jgi:GDP-L-fucose synthase